MPKQTHLLAGHSLSIAFIALACAGPGPEDATVNEGGTDKPSDEPVGAAGEGGSGGQNEGESGSDAGLDPEPPPSDRVEYVDGIDVATLSGAAESGLVDGPSEMARFDNPVNVATSSKGDIFVCDFENGAIRRLDSQGTVSTVFKDTRLLRPFGIVAIPDGRLYVEADGNTSGEVDGTTGTLWEIDTATGTGTVLAENMGRPRGLALSPQGNLIVADVAAHVISTFDPVTGTVTPLAGVAGEEGFEDGSNGQARFRNPYGMGWLPNGDIVVADAGNHAIRVVTLAGGVSTLAGSGAAGMVDGDASEAFFNEPKDVAVAPDGTIYVTDAGNHRIRRITPGGIVQTIAGDGRAGYHNGSGEDAQFFAQEGLDITPDGLSLVVADGTGGEPEPYNRVRQLSLRSE